MKVLAAAFIVLAPLLSLSALEGAPPALPRLSAAVGSRGLLKTAALQQSSATGTMTDAWRRFSSAVYSAVAGLLKTAARQQSSVRGTMTDAWRRFSSAVYSAVAD